MRADDKRHGTPAGYRRGCRCDPCKKARADYMAAYRKAPIDEHALTCGRWMPDHQGIQRWHPNTQTINSRRDAA